MPKRRHPRRPSTAAPRAAGAGQAGAKHDPKGGGRWAPFVIFGGMFLIGAIGVTVVGVAHCNREQPYLDQVKLPYNPNEVRPIPPKIIPPGLGK